VRDISESITTSQLNPKKRGFLNKFVCCFQGADETENRTSARQGADDPRDKGKGKYKDSPAQSSPQITAPTGRPRSGSPAPLPAQNFGSVGSSSAGVGQSNNQPAPGRRRSGSPPPLPAQNFGSVGSSSAGVGQSSNQPAPARQRGAAAAPTIGLERFRNTKGDRLILAAPAQAGPADVRNAKLSLKQRFTAWKNDGYKYDSLKYGSQAEHQEQNKGAKGAFYASLEKAEGPLIAQSAVKWAGLGPNWDKNGKPLRAKKVTEVLDKAQSCRVFVVDETEENFTAFMSGNDLPSRKRSSKPSTEPPSPPSLMKTFRQAAENNDYPRADAADPQMATLIRREIREDPRFAKQILKLSDLDTIAQRGIQKFYDQKKAGFREQHPGLAQFADGYPETAPRQDNRSFALGLLGQMNTRIDRDPEDEYTEEDEAEDDEKAPSWAQPKGFRQLAQQSLRALQDNTAVLGKSAYDPQGIDELAEKLRDQFDKLNDLDVQLARMGDDDQPTSEAGEDFRTGLIEDIRHNKDLLIAKASFLEDIQDNNPRSEKAVAYSNLLWAHAAGHVFDKAAQQVPGNDPAKVGQLQAAKAGHIAHRDIAYQTASKEVLTEAPSKANKDTHPAVAGKAATVDLLQHELLRAGLPKQAIKELTAGDSLSSARREALNRNQDWAPIERDMIVTKDGVTRSYKSKITPAASISPRFARLYQDIAAPQAGVQGQPQSGGVSSGEKADRTHARNLKVSELEKTGPDGRPVTLAKVVGHGVLDMWEIPDPEERKAANESAAHEVLEAAITVNDRIRNAAIARKRAGNPEPVKVTHVSLNLTTPSPIRELPILRSFLPDHQELTYTEEQFRAFEASSTGEDGGPVQFTVDDPDGEDASEVDIDVDVDTITFSFGLNPLATEYGSGVEAVQNALAGWKKVYEQNRVGMIKLVGDLATSKDAAEGSAPGGFVGSAYDRLDPDDPQHQELAAKIRDQTNIVRSMFLNEDFRRGNGDPAKMGREILALQVYAEEALALAGADDQAATMSKGCKSDKDRGGVTDVELKHKLITGDMGGQILPDDKLSPEDQANYYAVAMASGQLENQTLNTGLPGSKEAGKLKERIPDLQVRSYLEGLGKFAKE
jgi:phosphatidylinositol-4,5-bisphosphate 4-phosphatase